MQSKPYLREISLKRDKIADPTEYPFIIPAVRHLDTLKFDPDVTFLVGENGTGKSTLLEAVSVALGFNAEGGTRNFNFSTRVSHSELYACLRLVRSYQRPRDGYFLRAESFFNVATEIERLDGGTAGGIIDAYGGRSLHEQSTRWIVLGIDKPPLPGTWLVFSGSTGGRPVAQPAVANPRANAWTCASGIPIIVATHSPILLTYPNVKILLLDQNGYKSVKYQEIEHYQVMRRFLSDPEEALKAVFAESGDLFREL
jgi:predicted ATPase